MKNYTTNLFFCFIILFNSLLLSQTNHVTSVGTNNFTFTVIPDKPLFRVIKKGKFIIRDYYQFTDVSKPGTYKLPYDNIILAIPPNSKPSFKIISRTVNKINSVLPAINPEIKMQPDSTTSIIPVDYKEVKNISNIKPVLEVRDYFWYRDFYCVYLKINTYSYNYSSNEITAINGLKIEANFNRPYSFKSNDPLTIKSDFDRDLRKIIYDSRIAEQFRYKPNLVSSDSTSNWINFNAAYIKLAVGKDGIYRISKNYLEQHGINTSSIDPSTFQLFNYGEEVPIYVAGQNGGSFGQGDYIEFWGTRNYPQISYRRINQSDQEYNTYLNRYTDTSYYFLTWGIKKGLRVSEEKKPVSFPSDTLTYFTEFNHYELNTMFQNNNNDEIANQTPNWHGNKTWYWGKLPWGGDWIYVGNYNLNFSVNNLYPDKKARLYIKLVSAGSNVVTKAHDLTLKYNNTTVDSQVINRFAQVVLSAGVNSNKLINGNNKLTITNYNNGTSPNYLALDWYDIEYPRQLSLTKDSLIFNYRDSTADGLRTIKINNANNINYILYRTLPSLKKIENYKIQKNALYFADTVSYNSQYCIADSASTLTPVFVYQKKFTNLDNPATQADYIAITNPNFLNAVQNYISQISGLYNVTTKEINVDNIYDQFGYGYPTPESIKLFVMNAMQNWKEPMPSYLTLIGSADYDYKGYELKSQGIRLNENYVPSYGEPVGDDWYVIFDNSIPIPQLKLGRIPINNASELNYYLNKVKDNIAQPYSEWNKRYLFFSGGITSDDYALFKSVNDTVISHVIIPNPIAGDYTHFYKTSSPQSDFGPYTSQQVQSAIDSGGVFISYIGHSGTETWDNSISKISQLKNTVNRFPLITDFGCSTNKFAEPDVECFGRMSILDNDGQAIGYVGNSSLGFTSTATTVPLEFYESLVNDSLRQVGNAHLMAKVKLFNYFGNSGANKIFAYTNVLLGDPTVELKIPDKPNLLVNENSFIFPGNSISESADSIKVGLIIENDGIAPNDTVSIDVKHEMSNGSLIRNRVLRVLIPGFKDTLFVWLRTKNLLGQHLLTVNIDPENKITELYKNDNSYTYKFNVYSASLRDLVENQFENAKIDTLYILNPEEYSSPKFNIKIQISNNNSFTTPQEYIIPAGNFYTPFVFNNLIDGKRYWYRYKIDSGYTQYSSSKTFINNTGGEYDIEDSVSIANQNLNNLKIVTNELMIGSSSVKISVFSAGFYSGHSCVISKDGTNLLSNTFFAGMGIVVFDPITMHVDTSAWFQMFNEPANVQALANLIYSIPNGKIVVMGVSDDARNNNFGTTSAAIHTLGGIKINNLQYRGSWAMIGRKGAAPGEALEVLKGPYDGPASIDSTFILNKFGELTTNVIGPASKWKNITVKSSVPSGDRLNYKLFGIKNDQTIDSLGNLNFVNSTASISQINAKIYPRLKLAVDFNADSTGTSPALKMLSVNFSKPPELGLNYQTVSISNDTVYQGNTTKLNYTIFNVGEANADSFNVNVYLNKPDKTQRLLSDTLITKLASMHTLPMSLDYKSNYNDGYGNMSFAVNVDPENKVTEIFKDNNYYNMPFYVIKDTITYVKTASIDITFNGNNIYNGDYVSPKPSIKFILHYGSLYPYSDTTNLNFVLDGRKIYYSQLDSISYDTINRQVRYTDRPALKDGKHILTVTGSGLTNQPQSLQKMFYVSNELKVLDVYNYPDPFKYYTYFTFNLTQIPDELKIYIYTVAGRLIKIINVPSYKLKNNFNKIYWDGRDEDGDIIANGVYLYKIVSKLSGKTYTDIQKLAVIR